MILSLSPFNMIFIYVFLVIALSSRNEVDALQAYKVKCAMLEAKTDEFHCNSSKLSQYEQVHTESK